MILFLNFFLCNIYYKMDCQQIILYGLLLIVAVYVLRDVFNLQFKIPLLEGQDMAPPAPMDVVPSDGGVVPPVVSDDSVPANAGDVIVPPPQEDIQDVVSNLAPGNVPNNQLPGNGMVDVNAPIASEPIGNNETFLPVEGIRSAPSSCYPQNTLTPKDLLPQGKEDESQRRC